MFGDGHPAIDYLLLLAIADDAIGTLPLLFNTAIFDLNAVLWQVWSSLPCFIQTPSSRPALSTSSW